MNVVHQGKNSLTSIQIRLLRDFAKTGQPNSWEAQHDIAQKSLEKAGIAGNIAKISSHKAYEQMVKLLPNGPPRTPYK